MEKKNLMVKIRENIEKIAKFTFFKKIGKKKYWGHAFVKFLVKIYQIFDKNLTHLINIYNIFIKY